MEQLVASQVVATRDQMKEAWQTDRLHEDPSIQIQRQKILDIIRTSGVQSFVATFIGAHDEATYVIDPNEFFDKESGFELEKEYAARRRKLDLQFYKDFMARMHPETIAGTIAFHIGHDIPVEVSQKMGL